MKKYIFLLAVCLSGFAAKACEICEKQQPRILRGITHGGGPSSNLDYVAIFIMVLITVATLFFSIKWIIYPGEKSNSHIKRSILNEE
ncbi:hypothetical protein [Arachidicoccus sp.]|uniref:hypothetical protein n=1 Tax=Arachidicoccus sp. TaxID=1872624 RepID=UPI003D1AAD70